MLAAGRGGEKASPGLAPCRSDEIIQNAMSPVVQLQRVESFFLVLGPRTARRPHEHPRVCLEAVH